MSKIKGIYEPCSLKDALEELSRENYKIISGGTDILVDMRSGKSDYEKLLSIHELKELKYINLEDKKLVLGAGSTFTDVIESKYVLKYVPYLSDALKTVAGPQIRNMGTLGGNICNGITSADSVPMLMCLDAKLNIVSSKTKRCVDIKDFYKGFKKVDLEPFEILESIVIDLENLEDYKGHYVKNAKRKSMDIALISSAVLLNSEDNYIKDIKISLGVAAPVPMRCYETEKALIGKEINEDLEDVIRKKVLEETSIRDSWKSSKKYREQLTVVSILRSILSLNRREEI